MKAIVWTKYGSPDVLQLRDIDKPVPEDDEILIRVRAANVNTGDCELRRFEIMGLFWLPLRLMIGIRKPRRVRSLGQEIAGVVEAVGADVTRFKPGDQVFAPVGLRFGGYSEHVCLSQEKSIVIKPSTLSYEEASAIPVGGQHALHFLREAGVGPGSQVVIFGSTGTIGTVAVQLAKHMGATVTAICSTGKIDLVESLGADHIVDYTKEDFTENGLKYDVIFDTIGKSSFSRSMGSLKDDGVFIQANPSVMDVIRGPLTSFRGDKRVLLLASGDSPKDSSTWRNSTGAAPLRW